MKDKFIEKYGLKKYKEIQEMGKLINLAEKRSKEEEERFRYLSDKYLKLPS